MSERRDQAVRELAEEIVKRYGVDLRGLQIPAEDDTRADWIEARIRGLLAEREEYWLWEPAAERDVLEAEVVDLRHRCAILREALEDEFVEFLDNDGRRCVCGAEAADEFKYLEHHADCLLAPGAGEREAEVIRAARGVKRHADGRWITKPFREAVYKLLDRVGDLDALRAARGGEGEG